MNPKNYGGIDVAKKNFVIGIYGQDKTKTGEHAQRPRQSG